MNCTVQSGVLVRYISDTPMQPILVATGEYLCGYQFMWEAGFACFPHKNKTSLPCREGTMSGRWAVTTPPHPVMSHSCLNENKWTGLIHTNNYPDTDR